jgi:hypothetical protein
MVATGSNLNSDQSVLIPATVPEHNSATLISGGTSN